MLGGVMVRCRTYDREVVGWTFGRVTIKCLLLGVVTVSRQVNHLRVQYTCIINTKLNLTFYPSG